MKGVFSLAEALCSYNNLTQIHIRDGGRDQLLLKFCPDTSYDKWQLKVFRIHNTSLLPTDIASLCNRLAQCHCSLELDLSHNSLNNQAISNLLEVLPKMESLRKLNVSHSVTSTTGAIMLVSSLTVNQRVTSVELSPQSDSLLHFESVKAEQASCRLTHFHLSSSNLERLLGILQQGPRISYLDLSSDQMDDEGVKHLVDFLPSLQITDYVNLSNNCLTQHGLLDVVSVLSTCNNVSGVEISPWCASSLGAEKRYLIWFRQNESCEKTLSIKDCNLKHEHLVKLAEIVSNCYSPVKLLLEDNLLQSDWIKDFVKLLGSIERQCTISIKEDWIRAEEAVCLVCCCLGLNKNIKTIRVHQTTLHLSLTSASKKFADPSSSLITRKIGLVNCAVEGHQLAQMMSIIQKCPLLTELDFSHNSLGKEGAEFLCSVLPSLPNLTSLSIGSKETCPDVLEKLTEDLLRSTVQDLNLSGHVIRDTAAQIMSKVFPRLVSLNLSECKWSTTARLQVFKALGLCVNLEELCLDLDEDSSMCLVQVLRKNKAIQSLKISTASAPPSAKVVFDLFAAMYGLSQVKDIELEGWRMAQIGVDHLTKLLPAWTDLRKISLSKNLINDPSGDKLVGALVSCSHLEELDLSSNTLGDLTAARMALVLPSLTHMTVLDISENRIGCEGLSDLSKAMMCLKNLTKINLTSVGTSKLCPVAASLVHCPLIQDVGLGWNNCGDEVVLELAKVLPSCQKLKRIDLESNNVSAVGAEALLSAVHLCPALHLIRLWRNKVSSIEAQRLSEKDKRLNFSPT